jgi:enoyl-CoA hydratase
VLAEEALSMGLLNSVIDGDLVEGAIVWAGGFTQFGQPALLLARRAVLRAGEVSLEEGLEAEADLSTMAFQTADAKEGMQAFVEKRKAVFRDE